MIRINKEKILNVSNRCIECGGELESCDNENSHTNLRTCTSNLRERVSSLLDEINYPEG